MAADSKIPKFKIINVKPEFKHDLELRATALDKKYYEVVEQDARLALEHEALLHALRTKHKKIYLQLVNLGLIRSSNGRAASASSRGN